MGACQALGGLDDSRQISMRYLGTNPLPRHLVIWYTKRAQAVLALDLAGLRYVTPIVGIHRSAVGALDPRCPSGASPSDSHRLRNHLVSVNGCAAVQTSEATFRVHVSAVCTLKKCCVLVLGNFFSRGWNLPRNKPKQEEGERYKADGGHERKKRKIDKRHEHRKRSSCSRAALSRMHHTLIRTEDTTIFCFNPV